MSNTQSPNPAHKSPVPSAVAAAAKAAEDLIKQQESLKKGEQPPEGETTPQATNPAPEPSQAQETASEPSQPEPPPQPTHPSPQPEPPPKPEASLQQERDAAVGRARNLQREVDDLRRLIATMQTTVAPAPAPAKEMTFEKLLKPEEIEEYGENFIDMVKRAAMEMVGGQLRERDDKIAQLEARLQGTTQVIAHDADTRFWQELDSGMPQWRQINQSEEWKNWLMEPDVFSGRSRNDLLNEAQEQRDAKRVVAFLSSFQREASVTAPSPGTPTQPAAGKVSLDQFAAPGRTSAGGTPTNGAATDKSRYTRIQISQFFADKNAGRYRGREQEAQALEADIFAAGREGRIDP